ncbi:IspD/TarI family cytidylyltransferase [Mycolicibacterium tusciae]|uniref:IspD/TarI family cytidylyltransferase n=1 Tax=Mycolicibacterium tusciae TaxID=75922 RepID=UPI00024A21D7|nr:2-C-methyl-D-erythritol 4-phosphate cytidylyltransferase [Mycolicibacterium tusciae]
MDVSVVVPLPISVADNMAAAFLPLVTAPPLVRIVGTLLGAVAESGRIVVAAAEPLIVDVDAALASDNLGAVSVAAVTGSASRADCLKAALEYLRHASFSTTHVLVHDIASPLVSAEVAQRVIDGLQGGGAVVMPALAVTDSVKAVDVHGSVSATVDRSVLRAIQFPRGFAIDALAGLLAQHTSDDFDEIAVALGAAAPITFVDGDPHAFRAELPRDTEFFEAIIASR